MNSSAIKTCRLCGSPSIESILDLGDQPPANNLRIDLNEELEKIPLIVSRCNNCTAMQLTETVEPELLFRDYVWVTGTSETTLDYSKKFYDNIIKRCDNKSLFVVEIASNDGTFLQQFRKSGHRVLGVDPAENLAAVAEKEGIPTLPEFFGAQIANGIVEMHGTADVVIARNVLPHVPDPNDVISGIVQCLTDTGLGAIEFHWTDKILSELHYDSIYHEHYFYHSLNSINKLLELHNLCLFDVSESPISGGSLVAYFSKSPKTPTSELNSFMRLEAQHGLAALESWKDFARRALEHRIQLRDLIQQEINSGRKVIGYGASARSSTLLNFCGIDKNYMACIADQNPRKHGKYTPGTNILVVDPDKAMAENPGTILILAWNFKEEIINWLKASGFQGNIILPLPNYPQLVKI